MTRFFFLLWTGTLGLCCHAAIYTNEWALRIRGDAEAADRIAHKHHFTNLGQIGDLKSYYRFRHRATARRATLPNKEATVSVATETEVEWLQQQVLQRRVKRTTAAHHVTNKGPAHLGPDPGPPPHFNDPMWSRLWDILCSQASAGCRSRMEVAGAWGRGYSGRGVVVSVLDDGIQREHPELEPNYDPLASCDVSGHEPSPPPNNGGGGGGGGGGAAASSHGTGCAGMVAAAANNSRCAVGVAFRARIGGVRVLDGDVTDAAEARALSFRPQHVDVFVAGWGPEDDGGALQGPGPLARLALRHGAQTGRGGRGSVFVWTAGNGGGRGDHCSCDGYSNSVYSVTVSGGSLHGSPPPYLERCASILAAAYSQDMLALGPQGSCHTSVSGTSVSASVAAGVIALALEANPSLTWRDVQHIIVRTSRAHHLPAPDWRRNAAGYKVSHLYGFGLLDAEGMVMQAERWKPVSPQHVCVEEAPIQASRTIHPGGVLTSVRQTKGCSRKSRRHVAYAEHVVVRLTVVSGRRGDLSITLTSPSGTVSQLLDNRPFDNSTEGFQNWEFMTTHCWGERAAGEWTLRVRDTPSEKRDGAQPGRLEEWSLLIYGTSERPNPARRQRAPSAEMPMDTDSAEEYSGPCDPECSDDGCEGPGPRQCVTCLHFFLKFKNDTRLCVSECPRGFWGDRRRCKRCYSSCASCTGSRSDQCTSCLPGHHLVEGANKCVSVCGDYHYLDHDANMCRKCRENCLRCTSYSICTECTPDTSLEGNRCQRSCASGSFYDEAEGRCAPCNEACATCADAGAGACKRCAEGYLMEEWRCVSSCGAGFHAAQPDPHKDDGQRICRRCDASCLTCSGPSRGNCSSCSSGHSLQEGVCVVNTACTDGEYQDGDGECHACDATCLKCTGPQNQDCISCASSRALDEGRCVAQCSGGKYRSAGRCHLCDHTCATCADAGPANCTSCHTDKFGVERYLHEARCLDACPGGFYHTQQRSCEACSDHCRLCTSPAHCLSCNASYYISDGMCAKRECGEGEVEDPDYEGCMSCEEGCRQCVLYNPRHCLSCTEGFYNFQDGCYKNCPAKTYSVEEEMTCVPCDDSCVSCDQHECYWCETDLFLSEGRCVSACPDGFYGDDDTSECEECHPDCAACGGPEGDECLACSEGKSLADGECVPDLELCPVKTFRSDDGECEDCHPTCEACSGEERSQCTKCAKGRFLTAQQTCVSKCPAGFFAGRLSGVCEVCPAGCSLCVDAQRCTRCQNTRKAPLYLQDGQCVQQCVRGYPAGQVCRSCASGCASCGRNATHCLSCDEPLLLHRHQCVEECPPAHTLRDNECQRCPPACQECNPLGQCTECEEYHFLHEGLCVLDCPERFFEHKENGECARCHPDCDLCDGPSGDDCDACADPDATLHNGACVATCPSHTYRDAATGDCEDCDASCLTCRGPHPDACTSCREDRRPDGQGRCPPPPAAAATCSAHQYQDEAGQCHQCHRSCRGCSGPGKSHCLSCAPRHLLLNGTCVEKCPTGFYEAEQGCEACHASCQSCVGGGVHQCLLCKAHLFREGKECVEMCQRSHYGNAASKACERCHPSCGECAEGGEDSCLSCAAGLIYLRREGRCLPQCPPGFHHDATHRTCEPCHDSCRTCSGKKHHSCESCYPGYLLSGGVCESLCDMSQYPLVKGSSHSCEECDVSCEACRGPGPANCTACPPQAILEAGGRCLLCCRYEEDDGPQEAQQQDCCNCTESRGECILSTNLAFRNEEEEEEESRGNLTVFVIACVLLVLVLVAIVFLIKHSRSKRAPPDIAPRGYEKLGSGGGGGGGYGYSSSSNASYGGRAGSSGGHRFQEAQLVDLGERRFGGKADDDDDDDDDDEDEDIVYMGQDGTVYRKFRYGQLGDDNEDGLEYDDESYAFR